MEYYGNNDWRDYLRRRNVLMHYGMPRRSGRYPWGSGENPYHHGKDGHGINIDKKKLKTAAAVAGTAALAVGAGYLAKNGMLRDIDPTTGLKRIVGSETVSESLSKCNEHFLQSREWQMNCAQCTIAFEARMRGIDAVARPNTTGTTVSDYCSHFKGFTSESFCDIDTLNIKPLNKSATKAEIINRSKLVAFTFRDNINKAYPDGSRGMMFIPSAMGSHFMSWTKENGKITFYDPQNPNKSNEDNMWLFATFVNPRNSVAASPCAVRLDNLDFNLDTIGNSICNRGREKNLPFYKTREVKGKTFRTINTFI